jgi:hypothetical protein
MIQEPTVLINFSGGVDSTYYLYKWLLDNPDKTILVHHCLLFKLRREVEKNAVDSILQWFREKGYDNFVYAETEFSRKGISGLLYDVEVVYFMSGLLLKNKYQEVSTVLMPRCKEDLGANVHLARHLEKGHPQNTFAVAGARAYHTMMFMRMLTGRDYDFISDYRHIPKEEMIRELPVQLLDKIWYCREPVNNLPCENCFNCKRVIPVLNQIMA